MTINDADVPLLSGRVPWKTFYRATLSIWIHHPPKTLSKTMFIVTLFYSPKIIFEVLSITMRDHALQRVKLTPCATQA